ncbi:MAG: PilZ domain-containing protein [Candidatus Omnitrophota bacterium]
MENERRKDIRVKKTLYVQCFNQERNIWDMVSIRDISESGICINSDYIFIKDTILTLRLKLAYVSPVPLEINSKVIESKKFITRVQFIDLNEQQRKTIKDYITLFANK